MAEKLHGTILHVDDELFPRNFVKDGFASVFGYPRNAKEQELPDTMTVDGMTFRSFAGGEELKSYVSDDERLLAMLTVGVIVAIIDGQLEARGFFDTVTGREVAADLRRRVTEVLPKLPNKTTENSLYIISYSGGTQKFGDANIYKRDLYPDQLMERAVIPAIQKMSS